MNTKSSFILGISIIIGFALFGDHLYAELTSRHPEIDTVPVEETIISICAHGALLSTGLRAV